MRRGAAPFWLEFASPGSVGKKKGERLTIGPRLSAAWPARAYLEGWRPRRRVLGRRGVGPGGKVLMEWIGRVVGSAQVEVVAGWADLALVRFGPKVLTTLDPI